jgi:hypothetical protein
MNEPVISEYRSMREYCGSAHPGLALDDAGQMDRPDRITTIGQANIEAVMEKMALDRCRILHVGIGNSELARRFCSRAAYIDGITMGEKEKSSADRLGLDNYRVRIINKYSDEFAKINDHYDLIIDNNLFSYACCKRHFLRMMALYVNLIYPKGQILTERRGLNWVYKKPETMGMTFDELAALENQFPITVTKVNDEVYALKRTSNL